MYLVALKLYGLTLARLDHQYPLQCVTAGALRLWGFPGGSDGKGSACSVGGLGSVPGKIPWRRRAWQPTPASLPGESHGQRERAGRATVHGVTKESGTTEWLQPWDCNLMRTLGRKELAVALVTFGVSQASWLSCERLWAREGAYSIYLSREPHPAPILGPGPPHLAPAPAPTALAAMWEILEETQGAEAHTLIKACKC